MLKFLPDWLIKRWYYKIGAQYGDALSYINSMGKCVGFDDLEERFQALEAEYQRRGYRQIPINNFIDYGGGFVPTLEGKNIKLEEA